LDIRGPRLRKQSDEALAFTSSMASDGRIARHVIAVNMAHMAALMKAGEVDRVVGARCLRFLLGASPDSAPGARSEDFHQQLEQDAVDSLGVETAGFMNYGKSRNDQVATAIRMELRLRLTGLLGAIAGLQEAVMKLAGTRGGMVIPGYTHLQRAQPVTLAHHFFAHFDALQRDAERTIQLYRRVNLSPMGSAALAGTSVKVDRGSVARSLGFAGVVRNAMDAVSSRDVAVEALSCATMTMLDASRLAEELILWSSAEFGLVELDDSYSASSSIMPQKKNAVVAEVVRAKAGSVMGEMMAACAILKALPYSYNLDLQEVTPHLWRGLDDAVGSLRVLAGAVASTTILTPSLLPGSDDGSTAVGLANYLVRERGVSFRQAHSIVGQLVKIAAETGKPLPDVASARMPAVSARFGKRLAVDGKTARALLDPGRFLTSITTAGGSNPRFVPGGLEVRRRELSQTRRTLSELTALLDRAEKKLQLEATGLTREVKTGN
jgi:argininosuccinate lyase